MKDYEWIKNIIYHCYTTDHINVCYKLIDLFLKKDKCNYDLYKELRSINYQQFGFILDKQRMKNIIENDKYN